MTSGDFLCGITEGWFLKEQQGRDRKGKRSRGDEWVSTSSSYFLNQAQTVREMYHRSFGVIQLVPRNSAALSCCNSTTQILSNGLSHHKRKCQATLIRLHSLHTFGKVCLPSKDRIHNPIATQSNSWVQLAGARNFMFGAATVDFTLFHAAWWLQALMYRWFGTLGTRMAA